VRDSRERRGCTAERGGMHSREGRDAPDST
jgi:hypothetical protein